MCFVVTCWERADLLALVCGVYCEFVTFPLVSWVRCATWLYRFLILHPYLLSSAEGRLKSFSLTESNRYMSWRLSWNHYVCFHHESSPESILIYRSTSLCQTCLSRIHGLCRSDHPFPNFSPILHFNSTLLMSNSVIMKTRLFRSDFTFPKANFPFVYHCLYRSGQKWNGPNDKQNSNLPDWSHNSLNFSPINPLLQVIAN